MIHAPLTLVAITDPPVATELRTMLEDLGSQVVVVGSVIDAIAELHGVEFDVVIVARSLPPRGGIDVVRVARELSPDTQVIVLLDPGQTDAPVDCVRHGAFDFVHQPLENEELSLVVQRALAERRHHRQSAMMRASNAILGGTDSRQLPGLMVELAEDMLAADGVSLYRIDGNKISVQHAHGFATARDRDDLEAIVKPHVGERGTVPLLLPEDGGAEVLANGRIRSAILCPIFLDDRIVGVLAAERSNDPRPFRRSDAERAGVLASQIRLALDNARLLEKTVAAERLAAVGELAAGVAHEINSPLTYVLNNCLMALDELGELQGDTSMLESMLIDVREGAERIRDVARDLRILARGTTPVEVFDLSEAVRSALRMTGSQLRGAVTLTTDLDAGMQIRGSLGRTCQIFVNLLVNAAQAAVGCPHAVELHVQVHREQDRIVAVVRDTGPGIAAEDLGRIFEAFFTTKATDVGTGLGLSITRAIVVDQGGTIDVCSELGKGTTFTVEFPAAACVPRSISAA